MAAAQNHHHKRWWRLCPLWTTQSHNRNAAITRSSSVSSVARSILPARRRLRLDPSKKLYFPYEPGKQARSAVWIKNSSKSHVAFKFQTTAPKSCYMRPPGGILAPGEILIATVFKFVEHPENNEKPINQKSRVKFKMMSLKVREGTDYVPELVSGMPTSYVVHESFGDDRNFKRKILDAIIELLLNSVDVAFDEQRDQVTVERVLQVVFLDPESTNPALEKLKRQLAEADAAIETRKKPPAATAAGMVGEGLVIDEWKERREKYLARQQVGAVDAA